MIQKVDNAALTFVGGSIGYERYVPLGLDYIPLIFVFAKPGVNTAGLEPDQYTILPSLTAGVTAIGYIIDGSNVYINADSALFSSAPVVSVVILKNPYTLDTVSRTYP
jgi:hypothetical protein